MFEKWHSFFASVGSFVAQRMTDPHYQENSATDLLCQLLNERHSAAFNLRYSLADLKRDIEDLGEEYRVVMQTSKQLGAERISGLDLGIKFVDRRITSFHTRAILFQAKRLYANERGDYSTNSGYIGFDQGQPEKIRRVLKEEAERAGFYLLFNPERSAFSDPLLIEKNETRLKDTTNSHCHRCIDESEFYPLCPGTRVSDLASVPEEKSVPKLKDFYSAAGSGTLFSTFADFMTQLVQLEVGSEDTDVVRLAEGKSVGGLTGAEHTIEIVFSQKEETYRYR